jgi:hypothetical protein
VTEPTIADYYSSDDRLQNLALIMHGYSELGRNEDAVRILRQACRDAWRDGWIAGVMRERDETGPSENPYRETDKA